MRSERVIRSLMTLIIFGLKGVTGYLAPFSRAYTLRGDAERGWERGGGAVATYSSAGDGAGGGGAAASTTSAGQRNLLLSAYLRTPVGPMRDHVEVLLSLLEAQKASKDDPGGGVVLAEANNFGLEQSFPPRRKQNVGRPRRSDNPPFRLLLDIRHPVEHSSPCTCNE